MRPSPARRRCGVRFDVFARDSKGREYDIEIQRADRGAEPKRARYNSALMDANALKTGEDVGKLRDTYVIFITENDVMQREVSPGPGTTDLGYSTTPHPTKGVCPLGFLEAAG